MSIAPESRLLFFTTKDVAVKLGVSVSRVAHLLHEGKLTGQRWDREWMIGRESVERYAKTRRRYVKSGIYKRSVDRAPKPEASTGNGEPECRETKSTL